MNDIIKIAGLPDIEYSIDPIQKTIDFSYRELTLEFDDYSSNTVNLSINGGEQMKLNTSTLVEVVNKILIKQQHV